jgi:hypothetical protein
MGLWLPLQRVESVANRLDVDKPQCASQEHQNHTMLSFKLYPKPKKRSRLALHIAMGRRKQHPKLNQ